MCGKLVKKCASCWLVCMHKVEEGSGVQMEESSQGMRSRVKSGSEDCIVFCFREDGRFEISEDGKGEKLGEAEIGWGRWRSHNRMESKDSTQSESDSSSTGSFAFPVLRWDWSGSPEQMPKPKPKPKHKHRLIRFKCCRF